MGVLAAVKCRAALRQLPAWETVSCVLGGTVQLHCEVPDARFRSPSMDQSGPTVLLIEALSLKTGGNLTFYLNLFAESQWFCASQGHHPVQS